MNRKRKLWLGALAAIGVAELWHGPVGAANDVRTDLERETRSLLDYYELPQITGTMDDAPLTCTPETDVNEVRRMMLERHTRYLPVLEKKTLMGVISFYDVAKAVVEEQSFENKMLKAYIRDWPEENDSAAQRAS